MSMYQWFELIGLNEKARGAKQLNRRALDTRVHSNPIRYQHIRKLFKFFQLNNIQNEECSENYLVNAQITATCV